MRKANTQELIFRRRQSLKGIFNDFDKKQIRPTNQQLLDELKKHKPKYTISLDTLRTDKAEIFKKSKFVENLASNSYSRTIEECYNDIVFCSLKARDILDQKWSLSKQVTEEDFDKEGNPKKKITTTVTQELAQPKILAIKEIRECAVAISKLISGESLQVSASMWAKHTDRLEQELSKKNAELTEMKSHPIHETN